MQLSEGLQTIHAPAVRLAGPQALGEPTPQDILQSAIEVGSISVNKGG